MSVEEKKVLTKAERAAKIAAALEQAKKDKITDAENTMNQYFDEWTRCNTPWDRGNPTPSNVIEWFSRKDQKVFEYWYDPDLISVECVAKLKERAKELGYDDADIDIKNGKRN